MGKLSERISNDIAVAMKHQAMALINAGPQIRAAEYLETILRDADILATAHGKMIGAYCSVQVTVEGDEKRMVETLLEHSLFYQRTRTAGQRIVHYDVSVGSYNVTILFNPVTVEELREVA